MGLWAKDSHLHLLPAPLAPGSLLLSRRCWAVTLTGARDHPAPTLWRGQVAAQSGLAEQQGMWRRVWRLWPGLEAPSTMPGVAQQRLPSSHSDVSDSAAGSEGREGSRTVWGADLEALQLGF